MLLDSAILRYDAGQALPLRNVQKGRDKGCSRVHKFLGLLLMHLLAIPQ